MRSKDEIELQSQMSKDKKLNEAYKDSIKGKGKLKIFHKPKFTPTYISLISEYYANAKEKNINSITFKLMIRNLFDVNKSFNIDEVQNFYRIINENSDSILRMRAKLRQVKEKYPEPGKEVKLDHGLEIGKPNQTKGFDRVRVVPIDKMGNSLTENGDDSLSSDMFGDYEPKDNGLNKTDDGSDNNDSLSSGFWEENKEPEETPGGPETGDIWNNIRHRDRR